MIDKGLQDEWLERRRVLHVRQGRMGGKKNERGLELCKSAPRDTGSGDVEATLVV